jgi:hypothetical protein
MQCCGPLAAAKQASKALETRLGPGGQEDALQRQPSNAVANGPQRTSPAPITRLTAPQAAFAAAAAAGSQPHAGPMVRFMHSPWSTIEYESSSYRMAMASWSFIALHLAEHQCAC